MRNRQFSVPSAGPKSSHCLGDNRCSSDILCSRVVIPAAMGVKGIDALACCPLTNRDCPLSYMQFVKGRVGAAFKTPPKKFCFLKVLNTDVSLLPSS